MQRRPSVIESGGLEGGGVESGLLKMVIEVVFEDLVSKNSRNFKEFPLLTRVRDFRYLLRRSRERRVQC